MIVYLHITSWAGTAPGATHYYGKLRARGEKPVELYRELTTEEAKKMNEKDGYDTYRAGDRSSRFGSEQEIADLALNLYKEYFPKATFLIQGDLVVTEPQLVLDGPRKDELNTIFERCESLGWHRWRDHEDRMLELCDEWNALLGV